MRYEIVVSPEIAKPPEDPCLLELKEEKSTGRVLLVGQRGDHRAILGYFSMEGAFRLTGQSEFTRLGLIRRTM